MELRGRQVEAGIAIGLAAATAGLVILVLHMAVLTATQPGTSFLENYGQGRLPWIPIAFGLMMAGLTVASLLGLVAVWLRGPALARVASVLPAAPIAFWWIWASLPPPGGAPCDPATCAPRVADPIALAYSLPEAMVLYLVIPTGTIVALALLVKRRATRT